MNDCPETLLRVRTAAPALDSRNGGGLPAAIVLDADQKSALAAIRSLGRRGIHVLAGSNRRTAMGLHSRYVSRRFLYPAPLDSPDQFIEAVHKAAAEAGTRPVLFTFSDATYLPLYQNSNRLDRQIAAVYPQDRSVAITFSKAETVKLAQDLGIETPATCFPRDVEEVEAGTAGWPYPLVVKPRRTVTWIRGSGSHNGVCIALSVEEARWACARIARQTGEMPLLQEYISGEELGVEFLCAGGRVLASFAHQRIRSVSPRGGTGAVKRAIPENYKCIGMYGRRLVASLGWSGPVMIEFKVDRRDGRAKLVEINGRFWGSLPLALHAGVDFPWLYYCQATNRKVQSPPSYQEGVVSRYLFGDLLHLGSVLFGRDPLRPFAYPSRSEALWDFLCSGRKFYPDVASATDLRPAAAELLDVLWRAWVRACDRSANAFPTPPPTASRFPHTVRKTDAADPRAPRDRYR